MVFKCFANQFTRLKTLIGIGNLSAGPRSIFGKFKSVQQVNCSLGYFRFHHR